MQGKGRSERVPEDGEAETRQGPYLSHRSRDRAPGFKPGLSHLEQAGEAGHTWAKRARAKSPKDRVGTFPGSLHLVQLLPVG